MSGPQGSEPHQWQPPAQGSEDHTVAGASPWQQGQPPSQDATWHAPAYTPGEQPQYQQPGETAYAQQYPAAPPTYGPTDQINAQATQMGAAPQFGEPTQYGQYTQVPGQYGQPAQYGVPGQYPQPGQPGQYPQQYPPYGQPQKKSSKRLIWTLVAVFVGLPVLAILITGFGWPGFFITTELDVNQAQSGVQKVLTDETNGYGAKNVKDVKCNNGSNPKVEKGKSFDCTVSIDGTQKKVTATFQDGKGTYEVGRPQ